MEPAPGVEPGLPAYGAGVQPFTLRRRGPGSRTRTSISRLSSAGPAIGRNLETKLVPAVGVEPTWFRLKGGHAAATSRWRYGCGGRIRTFTRRGSKPRRLPLPHSATKMVRAGGVEPPRACARSRWATDYPT